MLKYKWKNRFSLGLQTVVAITLRSSQFLSPDAWCAVKCAHARSKYHLSETRDFWPQKYYVILHKQETVCNSTCLRECDVENNQHPWQYKRSVLNACTSQLWIPPCILIHLCDMSRKTSVKNNSERCEYNAINEAIAFPVVIPHRLDD